MAENTFMGVPRSKIPWAPTIDYDKCDFCMECDDFCPHRVFERREGDVQLVVANPENCVVFCRACAKTCGPDAISFPGQARDRGSHQEASCRGGRRRPRKKPRQIRRGAKNEPRDPGLHRPRQA